MTTSQPPDAPSPGPGAVQPADQGDTPTTTPTPSAVRPAVLAGSVLALLTYLCGFFGAFEFSFSMMLVLAGGLLALIGLLPTVGRVLVPSALLASVGFFSLLLQVTSTATVASSGPVRWVALAFSLLSAAAIVAALMFDVGVLTAPAPRPPRQPAPQQGGWNPYGQPGYGGPGAPQQPGAPGMFDPNQPGYGGQPGYGAPGSYGAAGYQQGGYGTPGYGAQQPGYSAQGYSATPSSTGGYGAVGAGGYGGAQGYGAQGYGSQGYPGSAGYGAPAYGASPYGAAGQPGGSGYGSPSGSAAQPAAGQGQATPAGAQGSGAQPAYGSPAANPQGSDAPGGASGPGTPGAPTLAPAGDGTPESTTPGVPATGGDTLADGDDERTRSFRPGGEPGSGS